MTWTDRVARARAEGACARCGEPHAGPEQRCRACTVLEADDQADRLDARRADGRCSCGARLRSAARMCPACREAERVRKAEQRARVRQAEQGAINRGAVGAELPVHAGPTVPGSR